MEDRGVAQRSHPGEFALALFGSSTEESSCSIGTLQYTLSNRCSRVSRRATRSSFAPGCRSTY